MRWALNTLTFFSTGMLTLLLGVACGDSRTDSPAAGGGSGSGGALGAAARGGVAGSVGAAGSAALTGGGTSSSGGPSVTGGAGTANPSGGAGALGGSNAGALGGSNAGALGGSNAGAVAGVSMPSPAGGVSGASNGGRGGSSGAAGTSGSSASAGAAGSTSGPFTLTSSAFAMGETIALKYRCRQANVSPPLSWTRGPAGTRSYAVTMLHSTSLHWALYDIPADTLSLPEDVAKLAEPPLPAGSKQVKPNVDGSTWFGYSGPCPSGSDLRRYEFFVYALSVETLTDITTASSIGAADAAFKAKQLASATLVGVGRASDQ